MKHDQNKIFNNGICTSWTVDKDIQNFSNSGLCFLRVLKDKFDNCDLSENGIKPIWS